MTGSTVVNIPSMDRDVTQDACQRKNVLLHPSSSEEHQIMRHTKLMAYLLSGKKLQEQSISAVDTDIIMAPWKSRTEKKYRPHVKR